MDQLLRPRSDDITLTIFSRPGCHLCHEMRLVVERVVRDLGTAARIDEVDIEGDDALEARYGSEIPVLLINGKRAAKYRVSEADLRRRLLAGGARAEN
jgi:hypothetical protein